MHMEATRTGSTNLKSPLLRYTCYLERPLWEAVRKAPEACRAMAHTVWALCSESLWWLPCAHDFHFRPLLRIQRGISEMAHELRAQGGTRSSEAHSLRLTVAVKGGWMPKVSRLPGSCMRAYLSLMGQRVASAIQSGEDVDFACSLDRYIALPEGEEASQLLDVIEDAVCSVDIVEERHPESNPDAISYRVLCGNRVALWRLLSVENEMPTQKTPRSAEHRLLGPDSHTASWRITLSGGQADQTGPKPYLDIDVCSEHVPWQSVAPEPRLVSPEQCAP